MKLGMLTFHRANNYGAVLQAFALNKFLNENISKCEVIDFVPNCMLPKNCNTKMNYLKKIKHLCSYLIPSICVGKIREHKFDNFRKNYIQLSKKTYYGDLEMKKEKFDYEYLISGSDQIFNTTLSGNSESYYLNFTDEIPKISYASSFGRENISDFEKKLISEELIKLKKISTRESNAANLIKKYSGMVPQVVLDPVFLLNSRQWEEYCSKIELPQKYIAVYAMEYSEILENIIIKLENFYKIPVITVPGSKSASKLTGKKIYTYGPNEFLSFIKNATYIITNSFHGLAFSNIFQKKYYCIAHSSKNIRLKELMSLLNFEHKIIYNIKNENLDQYVINGELAYSFLEKKIYESKEFLHNALTNG